jgi:hypothetical protein
MTDEIDEGPAADPMAKARAARAAKALAKAEAELAAAEKGSASASNGQPVVQRKSRAAPSYQGETVRVRITSWGHGQVSTGGDHGFERWAAGAEVDMPEQGARSLYNKRWIEPVDRALADKWVKQNQQEVRAAMIAKATNDRRMEHGVGVGEEWRSSQTGGELSFSPRDEEFREI